MAKRMFQVIDSHCGIPARVIVGGIPHIPGASVYEQAKWLEKHDDGIRKLMLREPRGYPALCCNVIVPPKDPRAQAGYIIVEQTEYPMMSGSNTISVVTTLLETGMIPMAEPYTDLVLEAPAGLIEVRAKCEGGLVTEVAIKNVPAFAELLDVEIDLPLYGKIKADIAWGGMYFVIADVRQFKGLEIRPEHGAELAKIGALLVGVASRQLKVAHPDYPGIGISIAQISGPTDDPRADWKNTVAVMGGPVDLDNPVTWTGALDRSPCGTGTCAKMAVLHAKGELKLNQKFRHQGVIDTIFTGELLKETRIHGRKAVVPTVSGRGWITAHSTIVLDASDPFQEGYRVGDIWG